MKFKKNELFLFDYSFGKVFKKIITSQEFLSLDEKDNKKINEFLNAICGYFTSVNYGNSKFSVFTHDNNESFYCETTIIDNYLYYINNKLSQYLNISFILLIISPELCFIFYLIQLNYEVDENEINELYKKIIKDNSTIKDCFVNKNIYDKKIFIVPFKWRVF